MNSKQDFLKIGDRVKKKWRQEFYKYVDFCGLEPVIESNDGYESTPINTMTFATTGGNGVHFGLLTDVHNGRQPIVMTVPMVSKNVVLAETLDEFLGLGFYNGWFPLEQLVYDFECAINYYSTEDLSLSAEQKNFLELMRNEFNIKFSPLKKDRLETLRINYADKLEIKAD